MVLLTTICGCQKVTGTHSDGSVMLKNETVVSKEKRCGPQVRNCGSHLFAWIDGSGFPYAKNLVNASVRIGNLSE